MNYSKSLLGVFFGILMTSTSWAGGKPAITLSVSAVPAEGRLFTDVDPLVVCAENLSSRVSVLELAATAPGAPLHTGYIFSFLAYESNLFDSLNLTESLFYVRIMNGNACSHMTGLVLPGTYFNINHIRYDDYYGRMREDVNHTIMGLAR